jgi:hypothetical protein
LPYENFLKDFEVLLVRKIFLRKKQNRDHTQERTATKIVSGERKLRVAWYREVLAKFPNPVATIMKNRLVTRDIDLLGELAKHAGDRGESSMTRLDPSSHRVLEPRTSSPHAGVDAIRVLERPSPQTTLCHAFCEAL